MNEHHYLYALTWADCPEDTFGPGVDPRHAVELIRYGQLAAVTSRVGWDQFDLAKLQQGSADVPWLSKVALRHNEIIAAIAQDLPVLPLRLGTLFESRPSLIARLTPYEASTAEFLRRLGDRQEWAAKAYVDEDVAEKAVCADHTPPRKRGPLADYMPARPYGRVDPPHTAADAPGAWKELRHAGPRVHRQRQPGEAASGGGTQYLVARKLRLECHRQVEAVVKQAVSALEARLKDIADAWCRLRLLSHRLTNRPDRMVWNAAFLLTRPAVAAFQAACEQLGSQLAPKGLSLEATGPWPAYDFCPSLEAQDESSHAVAPAGHISQ
jgi:hypothetical protein